jgi:tetratricopeptide (TPR) repeat protein
VTYLAILALVAVTATVYKARGVIGVIWAEGKMRAGDYDGALRRLRWAGLGSPNAVLLHKQGLVLALAGRSDEAEVRYRKALELVQRGSVYPRERLLASLGYALIDLVRDGEAEQCFHRAIEAGDETGNAQDGLAELRLVRGVEAETALDYAGQAIEHARRRADGRIPGSYYALQAWALGLLGRDAEAREALGLAFSRLEPNARRGASLHWRAGMALAAMREPEEARQHFQKGRELDARGKYGRLCAERL